MIKKYIHSSQPPREKRLSRCLRPLLGGLFIGTLSLSAQATTVFVSKNGKDTNSGLEATQPLATVNKGITVAVANGGGEVWVAVGKYDEAPITLPAGIRISGGWDNTFAGGKRNIFDSKRKIPSRFEEKLCEDHTCLTTTQGSHVVSTMGSSASDKKPEELPPRYLSQLIIIGPDCANPPGNAHCDSSFGVIVDQPNVHLDYLMIKAGIGNTGIKGKDGQAGTGTCTRGGTGGKVDITYGATSFSCQGGTGQVGESAKLNGVIVALGGEGGPPGEGHCSAMPAANVDNADPGKAGKNGIQGVSGKPGVTAPLIDLGLSVSGNRLELELNHNTSGNGSSGSPGSGGGGGGAGASWNYFIWGCLGNYPVVGGIGHVGNPGGCGGGGGMGGSSGAGAFALVINNAKVTSESITLLGGQGGTGGTGGNGALGSQGGKDNSVGQVGTKTRIASWDCAAAGNTTRFGGVGGPGGHGGDGGDGGGGAGGNGGPAVTLVKMGKDAFLEVKNGGTLHIKGGRAGMGGAGGKNGACANNPQTCVTAGSGTGGNPSLNADPQPITGGTSNLRSARP